MEADIFVPTSNRLNALNHCLNSLNDQSLKDFKIYLVGLKKDSNIKKLIQQFKNLKIIYFIQKDKGIVNAANEALKKAKNKIFIRIDDDVILDKDWFKQIVHTFKLSPKIGGVTGPTLMNEQDIKARDVTAFLDKFKHKQNYLFRFLHFLYNDYLYEKKVDHVSQFLESGVFTLGSNYSTSLSIKKMTSVNNLEACNLSCRTKLLRAIGGFDEIFSKGLGDYHEADVALKIKDLGYQLIFNPKAKLHHNVEVGAINKSRPNSYHRIQNFIIFYQRHFKIKNINQLTKFLVNLVLQNSYYTYKCFTTGDLRQLTSFPGTLVGLSKAYILNNLRYLRNNYEKKKSSSFFKCLL